MVCHALAEDVGTLRLETLDLKPPGPGEVRVAIRACSVNFPDILMIQGKYQRIPPLPFSPGIEVAGDVAEVGEGVTAHNVGDPVMLSPGFGGFAESIVASADIVRSIPKGFDYAQAAAYPAAYLTAYVSLVRRANLQPGETLLVHGAAGGVGLAAVEVGKLLGATVIATASSGKKLAVVKEKGADHVICYGMPDGSFRGFREEVKLHTRGQGADVIYDPVGGDVFDESIRCIAWGGRLLVVGFTSGRIPSIPANMPLIKGFSVVGVRAGEYGRRDPVKGRENIETLRQWAEEGRFTPHICATFPLEQSVDALRMLVDRKAIGKVVITMGTR
jgi:NADPH2:quinone reductase